METIADSQYPVDDSNGTDTVVEPAQSHVACNAAAERMPVSSLALLDSQTNKSTHTRIQDKAKLRAAGVSDEVIEFGAAIDYAINMAVRHVVREHGGQADMRNHVKVKGGKMDRLPFSSTQ